MFLHIVHIIFAVVRINIDSPFNGTTKRRRRRCLKKHIHGSHSIDALHGALELHRRHHSGHVLVKLPRALLLRQWEVAIERLIRLHDIQPLHCRQRIEHVVLRQHLPQCVNVDAQLARVRIIFALELEVERLIIFH